MKALPTMILLVFGYGLKRVCESLKGNRNPWVSQKRTSAAEAVRYRPFLARLKPCPSSKVSPYQGLKAHTYLALSMEMSFLRAVAVAFKRLVLTQTL